MAKQTKTNNMTLTKGSIPMIGAGGRKFKVRNPTPHDFTSEPSLTGKVVAFGSIEIEDEEREMVLIDTGATISQVYRTKALEDVFTKAAIGDTVELIYGGEKELGGGRSFKKFSVAVWTE